MTEATTFPKMLYKGGIAYGENGRGVPPQDTITVVNEEDEAAARAEGFDDATPADPDPQPAAAPIEAGRPRPMKSKLRNPPRPTDTNPEERRS